MTIGDKFDEGFNQQKCYSCKYVEEDNGDVNGNTNCPDKPTDDMEMDCPSWATSGCYTGTAVHNLVCHSFKF